jgi:hypothetical protein
MLSQFEKLAADKRALVETPDLEELKKQWKSTRLDKRNAWGFDEAYAVALNFVDRMPLALVEMVVSGRWKGHSLIQLKNGDLCSPCKKDLTDNYVMIKPISEKFNDAVPSGYFIADMLLIVDFLLHGKLLAPSVDIDKRGKALAEAKG